MWPFVTTNFLQQKVGHRGQDHRRTAPMQDTDMMGRGQGRHRLATRPGAHPRPNRTLGSHPDWGCSHLPSGEKEMLCTEPLKWKWCSTDLQTKLTSSAAPPARGQRVTSRPPKEPTAMHKVISELTWFKHRKELPRPTLGTLTCGPEGLSAHPSTPSKPHWTWTQRQ